MSCSRNSVLQVFGPVTAGEIRLSAHLRARARNTSVGFSSVDTRRHPRRGDGQIIEFRLKGCFTTVSPLRRSHRLASSINLQGFSRVRFQSSLRTEGSYLPCPVSLRRAEKHCRIIFAPCSSLSRRRSFIAAFKSVLRERHLICAKLRL